MPRTEVWTEETRREVRTFFIVGAPRCGTTALSAALRSHPGICFSMPKEPHYFTRLPEGWTPDRVRPDYLLKFFRYCENSTLMLGDGSVSYLYSDAAFDAIEASFENPKYVVIARNPLEMIPSYHQRLVYLLDENEKDLRRAWALQEAREQGRSIPRLCRDRRLLRYRDIGRVGERMHTLMKRLPRDRLHFALFDDFVADPLKSYRDILAFLGLPDDGRQRLSKRNETLSSKSAIVHLMISQPRSEVLRMLLTRLRRLERFKFIKRGIRNVRRMNREALEHRLLTSEMRSILEDAFADDVEILSKIFNRDLYSLWLGKKAPTEGRRIASS